MGSFLATSLDMQFFIDQVVATADHVKHKLRSDKTMMVSFDEWNVWDSYSFEAAGGTHVTDEWRFAPRIIEDVYSVADAVVVGTLLITLLKNSDRVTSASLAQLANVIAPIMTEPGGPAWRQTIFYPFSITSRLAAGQVLRPRVSSPSYGTKLQGEAPIIDSVATLAGDRGAVFLINRDQTQARSVSIDAASLGVTGVVEAWTLADDDHYATNTLAEPDRVTPTANDSVSLDSGTITITLPPVSWTALAFTV